MANMIKPIEASSVHQIQSGQVIVDLCSVVKELVENALDADASSIEVRFKNYGLDAIEVQDNGTGIAESNYEGLGLKHYTSKLATFDDLARLQTFGFRGEALSSLCALSTLVIITAQADEAPKGKKLEFEVSGKLKSTSLVAATRGTTVSVENLFNKLPVRQKELSKNVKREYGKVLSLLHAYACISTRVKLTVKNTVPKARSMVVFSTKGNATTRDNIANVYGAKTLPQLIALDLRLELNSTSTQLQDDDADAEATVHVVGHISRPVFGEGRQTPDRQMFFVNGRPCGLPQFAKAINEVYKSFNVSQSPFIFADFRMNTNSYDVNVSPDKRTIYLHDASALTDRLKDELTKKFDLTDQTVPQSQMSNSRLPAFRPLNVSRSASKNDEETSPSMDMDREKWALVGTDDNDDDVEEAANTPPSLFKSHFDNITSTREEPRMRKLSDPERVQKAQEKQAARIVEAVDQARKRSNDIDEYDDIRELNEKWRDDMEESESGHDPVHTHVRDFNTRMDDTQQISTITTPHSSDFDKNVKRIRRLDEVGIVPNAFDSMRSRKASPEVAVITIGDKTVTRTIGTPQTDTQSEKGRQVPTQPLTQFSQRLRKFDMVDGGKVQDQSIDEERDSDIDEAEMPRYAPFKNDTDGVAHAAVPWTDMKSGSRLRPVIEDRLGLISDVPTDTQAVELNAAKDAGTDADRTQEEYRVAELIRMAESAKYVNSKEHQRRLVQAMKGSLKHSTVSTVAVCNVELGDIFGAASAYKAQSKAMDTSPLVILDDQNVGDEERLSLTISKPDFERMHIAGQFNLGFIIAVRPKTSHDIARQKDELFIIDQHASDEKYNFERLQAETIVGNQRLVHPIQLDLTAVEEEVVLENGAILRQNGFMIDADLSGNLPVGQRCQLLSLPLSKEVTFNTRDLEELIHLLSESHISADSAFVPRPGKVRKMFAMRACRSSIMIGKTLSKRQMRSVLDHMGQIDKPWNCPHGRPTMRHLTSLEELDSRLWREGNGVVSALSSAKHTHTPDIWHEYVR